MTKCPSGKVFSSVSGKCHKPCNTDQEYNAYTNRCRKKVSTKTRKLRKCKYGDRLPNGKCPQLNKTKKERERKEKEEREERERKEKEEREERERKEKEREERERKEKEREERERKEKVEREERERKEKEEREERERKEKEKKNKKTKDKKDKKIRVSLMIVRNSVLRSMDDAKLHKLHPIVCEALLYDADAECEEVKKDPKWLRIVLILKRQEIDDDSDNFTLENVKESLKHSVKTAEKKGILFFVEKVSYK